MKRPYLPSFVILLAFLGWAAYLSVSARAAPQVQTIDKAGFELQVQALKNTLVADVDAWQKNVEPLLFPDVIPPPPPPPPPSGDAFTIEGYGPKVVGVSGTVDYHVTSNADDGSVGTLRHAVSAGGRHIVFDQKPDGDIKLTSDLRISKSNIFIDGFTSKTAWTLFQQQHYTAIEAGSTEVDNVIIRGLRCDGGNTAPYLALNFGDVWGIDGGSAPVRHITIDHNTLLRSSDGTCDHYGECSDLTVSWNLIGNTGAVVACGAGGKTKRRISWHHNLIYKTSERVPRLNGAVSEFDWVENIVYGWETWDTIKGAIYLAWVSGTENPKCNIEGCIYFPLKGRPDKLYYNGGAGQPDQPLVYFAGNTAPIALVSNSAQFAILPAAKITRLGPLLKASIVPFVGAQFRYPEDEAAIQEVANALP